MVTDSLCLCQLIFLRQCWMSIFQDKVSTLRRIRKNIYTLLMADKFDPPSGSINLNRFDHAIQLLQTHLAELETSTFSLESTSGTR